MCTFVHNKNSFRINNPTTFIIFAHIMSIASYHGQKSVIDANVLTCTKKIVKSCINS